VTNPPNDCTSFRGSVKHISCTSHLSTSTCKTIKGGVVLSGRGGSQIGVPGLTVAALLWMGCSCCIIYFTFKYCACVRQRMYMRVTWPPLCFYTCLLSVSHQSYYLHHSYIIT